MTMGLTRNEIPVTDGDLAIVTKMLADVKFNTSYRASGDVASLRAATAKMIGNPFFRPMPAGVTVMPAEIAGLPGEWITPPDAGDAKLIFFHGGGYIRGSLDLGRANAAEIALRTGLAVYAVGYRQAPEHPFPAAAEDATKVADAIGRDHPRFGLVGESCGGGMVLAAAMALRDQGGPRPFGVSCLSPFVDLTLSGDSWTFNDGKDIATRQMGADMIALYMQDGDPSDWRASPVFGDYSDLPPIQIVVGSHEGLLSEALTSASKAEAAGVDVQVDIFEAMPHGFTKYRFDAANAAMDKVGAWLSHMANQGTHVPA